MCVPGFAVSSGTTSVSVASSGGSSTNPGNGNAGGSSNSNAGGKNN
jgi:hypothetical protein